MNTVAEFLRTLGACTLTMSTIALLLLALTPALSKRYSAKTIYLAWLIVIVGFAVPFRPQPRPAAITVKVPASVMQWQPTLRPANTAALSDTPDLTVAQAPALPIAEEGAPPAITESPAARAFTLPMPSLTQLLFAAWAAGAGLTLALQLRAHRRFLRAVRRWSKPVKSSIYLQELDASRAALGIRASIRLYWCKTVDSPMLVGFIRPRILLPDKQLSLAEIHLVLRHELVHFRRGDLWGRLLVLIASAVHWFNPLMISVARAFQLQCEASCDTEVMRGMDMDTRKYYSRTILHAVQVRPGLRTALSTRYHGGRKTMKRRIMNILDLRNKRIGIMAVALLMIAVYCTGMTFAFGAGPAIREYVPVDMNQYASPIADITTPAEDGEARAKQLNMALGRLIRRNDGALSQTQQPQYDQKVFPMQSVTVAEWHEKMDVLRAITTPGEMALFLLTDEVVIAEPDDALDDFVRAALTDAGHAVDDVEFEYRFSHRYMTDTHSWKVDAYNVDAPDWTYHPYAIHVETIGDGAIGTLTTRPVTNAGKAYPLSGENRETIKARAVQFCEDWCNLVPSNANIVMISDYTYENIDMHERYAFVWIFADEPMDDSPFSLYPYDVRMHDANWGVQLAIGITSGKVYDVQNQVNETRFVNDNYAAVDWIARTGKEFPYPDDTFIWETLHPEIFEKMQSLNMLYIEDLTIEEKLAARCLGTDAYQLGPDTEWRALREGLAQVTDLQSYKDVLNRDYAGINQSPYGEPTREEIYKRTQPTIKAFGYDDYPYHYFTYSSGLSGGNPGQQGFTFLLDNEVSIQQMSSTGAPVAICVDEEGKATQFYSHDRLGVEDEPVTEAEREKAVQMLTNLVENHISGVAAYDPATIKVSTMAWSNSFHGRIVTALVNYMYTWESPEGETGEEWAMLRMRLDLDEERVIYFDRYSPSTEEAQEEFLTQMY